MGLWLILHKHFIAKPARATSLPRFVSGIIYELAHRMWPEYLPYERVRFIWYCNGRLFKLFKKLFIEYYKMTLHSSGRPTL